MKPISLECFKLTSSYIFFFLYAYKKTEESRVEIAAAYIPNNFINAKLTTKFIIADTIDSIKSINFEPWFKGNVDLAEGIWLGNGIGNQFTLKVTTNARALRGDVNPGFGYIIHKGKAVLIKLMSDE